MPTGKLAHGKGTIFGAITLIYILSVVFVIPSDYRFVATFLFVLATTVSLASRGLDELLRERIPHFLLLGITGLVFSTLVIVAVSPYTKSGLLVFTAFLLLALFLFTFNRTSLEVSERVSDVFLMACVVVISYEVASNIGTVGATYVNGAYDKNYFGIVLFLFWCWCWANKRAIGMAVCIVSALLIGSRNYLVMLVIFAFAQWITSHTAKRRAVGSYSRAHLSTKKTFLMFLSMLGIIVLLSIWWNSVVVGPNTVSEGEGWNDSSNAIRFNSNLFAISEVLGRPEMAIFGFDNDYIEAFQIVDTQSLGRASTPLDGLYYDGYRVVQPHHVILNMLVKEGFIYTFFYYLSLAGILAPYLRRCNLSFWLPYLWAGMFMHSLFSGVYLLLFVYVLDSARKSQDSGAYIQVRNLGAAKFATARFLRSIYA